jgi:APA family basic amino acid/polyamine antiporter
MDYSFVSTAITRRRPLSPHHPTRNATSSPATQRRTLKRTLNLVDLIFYGVGCSVGAGIYSLVGIGANLAGPSIALSFLLCGVACCFTSLAYAEFAARVPLAGSAYTFTYVSFGELCGWLVGWNLTLGYAVSAAVVARSWAEYLVGFVEGIVDDHTLTSWTTHVPIPWFGEDYECCPLAMVIIGLCTLVLVTGAKESTRFNTAMTLMNLTVLGFVLFAGLGSGTVHPDNLTPIFPHGLSGMAHGAGLVFFAYLGFDMVACLSEEVKNPERNMPIGIIGSLLVSMTIYVSVSIVVVGMAPASLLGEEVPIINALLANACCSHSDQISLADAQEVCLTYSSSCSPVLHPVLYFGSRVVSFGAIFGLTTATFACLMGQPRIFYSMAQDGLLFKIYGRVHPKTGVPTIGTFLTGIFTALIACFIDLESLANAISLGTLQVFTFVNAGVIILRTRPTSSDEGDEEDTPFDQVGLLESSSPLVRGAEAATWARSLGLVKQSSRQIRDSARLSQSSATSSPRPMLSVHQNGSKPHSLTLVFTVCSILASAGFSNGWHHGIVVVSILISISCVVLLSWLPRSRPPDTFACPMVPFVPLCGIVCNSYMMGSMPVRTVVRQNKLRAVHQVLVRGQELILFFVLQWRITGFHVVYYYGLVICGFGVLLWIWYPSFGVTSYSKASDRGDHDKWSRIDTGFNQ